MASKKKVTVSKELKEKLEKRKDYSYVSAFFKILNQKLNENYTERKEITDELAVIEKARDVLSSIKSEMVDMFMESGVPDVHTLAATGLNSEVEDDDYYY